MNPFINPVTAIPFIKNFIFDHGKLQRLKPEQMQRYGDKALRKMIKYAYKVPLYHKKYKTAGIHPDDIKGIKNINKLPFITKNDLVEHFPDGIIPLGYNKNNAQVICTSGSTGKPVSLYSDFSIMAGIAAISLRELKLLNLHWKKSKIAHVGNFGQNKSDNAFEKGFLSNARSFFSLDNYLSVNAFEPIKDIIKKLDEFKPNMIVTYPATFQHLAFFKNKGYGRNINPKVLVVGAAVTDEYTRSFVEDAFGCRMLNVYSSAESSADIALECMKGKWHINYDFYHLEAIDENMELVGPHEKGHVVLTRMFGKGTPIIRYTGMDDWVTLSQDYDCSCGLRTPIIEGGVHGRISASIFLPDGRLYPSASFASVGVVLKELKTQKVKQFQIVQKKIDEIEILLVIDYELHEEKPSVDLIFKKIKELYQKKVGPDVTIHVKEVKDIPSQPGKPSPLVISHVIPEKGYKVIDW